MGANVHECVIWQGATPTLLARLHGFISGDKANLTQASVSTITIAIGDELTQETAWSDDLDKTEVIFDTLQTGDAWDVDDVGYNFAYTIPEDVLEDANTKYQVVVHWVLTDGNEGQAVWRLPTKARVVPLP